MIAGPLIGPYRHRTMANFVASTNTRQQFAYLGPTTVCKCYFKNGKGGGGDRKQQVQVHWQEVDDTERLIFAYFPAIFFFFFCPSGGFCAANLFC